MVHKFKYQELPVGLTAVAIALSLLCAAQSRATEAGMPDFKISGFGTVGLTHSSEDQADFTNSPLTKLSGAGFSSNWSANVDSVLGLQVSANFTPQLSAVLQVISQQRYDGSYTPEVEWANIKYQVTPDFSIRLGRIAMPSLLVSDYRYVGYSIPWVRAPLDLYGQMPITKNDGLDASYRLHIGDATSSFQASYGNSESKYSDTVPPSQIRHAIGFFNTTELGAATFRLAYQETDLTITGLKALFDGFRQFGPAGMAIAEQYDANDSRLKLLSLGGSYDPGKWFVMGEWSRGKSSSFIGTQTGWYASGGYRIGQFTPFVTYSVAEKSSKTTDPGLNLASLPPPFVGSAAALNAGLNAVLRGTPAQTISLGSRWDFRRDAALKLQYDHINLDANSSGTLMNLQPGYRPGGTVNVFSVALNFVF